jgi:hypothetical protein
MTSATIRKLLVAGAAVAALSVAACQPKPQEAANDAAADANAAAADANADATTAAEAPAAPAAGH